MRSFAKKITSKLPAVLPKKKRAAKPSLTLSGETCANCGAPLYATFCAACGQRHYKGKNPYWEFLEDATDQMISPESKLWQTFFHLLVLPGIMTRNYFRGMRASYAPPLRLYFISLLAFFAAITFLDVAVFRVSMVASESIFTEDDRAAALANIDERITEAIAEGQGERMLQVLQDVRKDIEEKQVTERSNVLAVTGSSFKYVPNLEMFVPLADEEGEEEGTAERIDDFFEEAVVGRGEGPMNDFFTRVQNGFKRAAEDPRRLNNSLNLWLPRVMIVFVPMFAIFLRFFYWGKNHFLLNQMVFSLHFHTALFFFLTFFVIVQALAPALAETLGMTLFTYGFPVFLLLSLKNAYQNGWGKTIVKFGIILVFYMFAFTVMLAGVFLQGLAEV